MGNIDTTLVSVLPTSKYRLDTKMEISMCCSEQERLWDIVSQAKQSHYLGICSRPSGHKLVENVLVNVKI